MTQTYEGATRERGGRAQAHLETEADIILIAHPESQRLGSRFRLSPGTTLEIGRSAAVGISLPEVMSISRKHARLRYLGPVVTIEDLGSTNGTYINGQPIHGRTVLRSGDRFQTAEVHFKFLHEQDVESAYHLAIYELVAKDGLTEIFNKRKFEEELQRELARAARHQRPLSLIIFDLDEFKTIRTLRPSLRRLHPQADRLARPQARAPRTSARPGGRGRVRDPRPRDRQRGGRGPRLQAARPDRRLRAPLRRHPHQRRLLRRGRRAEPRDDHPPGFYQAGGERRAAAAADGGGGPCVVCVCVFFFFFFFFLYFVQVTYVSPPSSGPQG